MKSKYSLLMLLALIVSGCRSTTISSINNSNSSINNQTSSSEVSSSEVNSSKSSSSTSSSLSFDKTGWIEEKDESYAISNPLKWFYKIDSNKINVTNAMYFKDDKMLYFDFNGLGNYNDVNIYYHDSYVFVGETYTTTFSITSNVVGKIIVNEKEFDVKVGTSEISVERELTQGSATVSIQFGAKDSTLISNEVCIEIGDLNISKITNVKARLEHAVAIDNYTISLKEDNDSFTGSGYYGEFKFFKKAVHYSYGNLSDGDSSKVNLGYFENEIGIFSYTIKDEKVVPSTTYIKDDDNPLKGLYSTKAKIHLTSFNGDKKGRTCDGVPSLHKIDLSQFDYDLKIGESAEIADADSLRYLSYMLNDSFSSLYYSGVAGGKIFLNSNDELEITFSNARKINKVTFIISNIGTTENEIITSFLNGDKFYPANEVEVEVDEELTSMANDIENGNYTIVKPDGTKFYMNDKYSYMETIDEENNRLNVSGYIKTKDGLYCYSIVDGEVNVDLSKNYMDDNVVNVKSLDGLNSGYNQYFKVNKLVDYIFNKESNRYELILNESDYSFMSFTSEWFNEMALACDLVTLSRVESKIIIGANITNADEAGNRKDPEYKILEVSNIGSTSVTVLEEYFASLEA